MKYRVIKDDGEVTVLVEDGGIAFIREVDELDPGDGRQSTTDYYMSRITQDMLSKEVDMWEKLSEGNMSYNDWTTPFDDPEHVRDALDWLCPFCESWEVDETIWKDF